MNTQAGDATLAWICDFSFPLWCFIRLDRRYKDKCLFLVAARGISKHPPMVKALLAQRGGRHTLSEVSNFLSQRQN